MKRKKFLPAVMVLSVCIAGLPLLAQPYPASSYAVTETEAGPMLSQWLGNETTIDMQADPVLKTVVRIGGYVDEEGLVFGAFSNCSATRITLPDGLKKIDEVGFQSCLYLTEITIPARVEEIGSGAFSDCSSLKDIRVAPDNKTYKDIDGCLFSKDGTVFHTFPNAHGTEYEIPAGVTKIEAKAFEICHNLKSIGIPEGVTEIHEFAFSDCKILKHILLPSTLKYLGKSAFALCLDVESFTCLATTPPNLATEVFRWIPDLITALYVPEESVNTYKAADQWRNFLVMPYNPTGFDNPTGEDRTTLVYPNPATDYTLLKGSYGEQYMLLSPNGEQMSKGRIPQGGTLRLEVGSFPPACYILRIGNKTMKLIVK